MNIDDLTLGQLKQLQAMAPGVPGAVPATVAYVSPNLGLHVLVRTYSAGVHVGVLVAKDGQTAVLKNARRIWKWAGAFTCSALAVSGPAKEGTRVSVAVDTIELERCIEFIPTTGEARAAIEACGE